jgi:hypothetical protein
VFYFLVILFGVSSFSALMMFVFPSVVLFRRSFFPKIAEEQTIRYWKEKTCKLSLFDVGVCGAVAGGKI